MPRPIFMPELTPSVDGLAKETMEVKNEVSKSKNVTLGPI